MNVSAQLSEPMRQVVLALDGRLAFNEKAALKLVEPALQQLKAAPVEERVAFVFEAVGHLRAGDLGLYVNFALKGITASLLRGGLPLNMLDAVRLVEAGSNSRQTFPYKALLSALEKVQMTRALREALGRMRGCITEWHGSREMNEIHERIDALLHGAKEPAPVAAAAGWTRQVFQEIDDSPKQMAWRALFLHGRSLTQSNAPRRWQAETAAIVDRIGRPEVLEAARRWLAIGPMPGTTQIQMPEEEADYQKGFIWTLGILGDASIAPDIADFAVACFRKIPQVGAVSHRVGNACVNALSAMPGLDAVTQLSRLAVRVKYDVALRLIEKALAEAAERNHVSRADLEAMAVPTFGLVDGSRKEALGECEATLAIEGSAAVLRWSKDGKAVKTVPASVKSENAPGLAAIKKEHKELGILLDTLRLRMERQILSNSVTRFEHWKAWYIDHPVTSALAKRLIWEVDGQASMWWEGRFVDWAGNPVECKPASAVRLWHPIRSDVQTILSWRCWLEDRGIRQPFKQAHREVYLLTDAERQTATFSNRFAGHIVRQHQFAALCRERGWQFNLMGQWDSYNTPYLDLPLYGLRVEFEVEFPLNEQEISGHAIYLTISTDKVKFMELLGKPDKFVWPPPQPKRLDEIPPVVFSEVMRDVDLLVSVTSIGADPAWGTERRDDPHLEYWQGFAFGDLSVAAENRRSVIEALLPKLAIRDRCRLDGRFLVVRGDLHEYRIHLGSGNVMMEPGSRYLCIVRGPGDTAAALPLPFEGDSVLSGILSKAMLLAADRGIKDETIAKQLRN